MSGIPKPEKAEFDAYARDYDKLHASSIRASGEDPTFFARYKVEEVARVVHALPAAAKNLRILDFGCGIGGSIADMLELFPGAEIVGADVSSESIALAVARYGDAARFHHYDGARLPFDDGEFDIVFTSCVFHHIPEANRIVALSEIRRVLARSGEFFFFEHNPWNPLTVRAVKDCPFDADAILITAPHASTLLSEAGFASSRVAFTVFFPRVLAALRPLERFLRKVPIGAQYYLHARG